MGASERRGLSPDLALGRSRFQAWRQERKLGERIPRPLWDLAVRLAKCTGSAVPPQHLASIITACKGEPGQSPPQAPSSSPAFVELPAPILVGKECRLEFDNGAGATLRVRLVGYDAADVEALSRSFWNAR